MFFTISILIIIITHSTAIIISIITAIICYTQGGKIQPESKQRLSDAADSTIHLPLGNPSSIIDGRSWWRRATMVLFIDVDVNGTAG